MLWWVMFTACTPHQASLALPYTFEARALRGEVRVLPVVELQDPLEVAVDGYIGSEIPWVRQEIRAARVESVAELPAQLALALPGAVTGELAGACSARFRVGRFPLGGRERLRQGLRGRSDLDATLGDLAGSIGGDATLFTWVTGLDGRPLTAEAFPGEFVHTSLGPVIVDHLAEPYLVTVDLGLAMVTSDGEVVLRFEDRIDAVLRERDTPEAVASRVAARMASQIGQVWWRGDRSADPELQLTRR